MRAFSKPSVETVPARSRFGLRIPLSELLITAILIGGLIAGIVVAGQFHLLGEAPGRRPEGNTPLLRASIYHMSLSHESRTLLLVTHQHKLVQRDLETGEFLAPPAIADDRVACAAQSRDGRTIVAGYVDGTVAFCTIDGRESVRSRRAHSKSVCSLALSADGRVAASTCGDDGIRIWDTVTGQELSHLKGSAGWIRRLVFSPAAGRVAAIGDGSTVHVWDIPSGHETIVPGDAASILTLAFSPDGAALLTGQSNGTIRLCDAATGGERWRQRVGNGWVLAVAWSPGAETIACGGLRGLIQLWDGRTRKRLATLTGHQNCVRHVQFSPDGRRLYSAGYDGTVRTWDVQTLTEIRRFEESLR